jgi:predicted TIM-barrel fold metal-dependent hydrolase
MPIGPVLIDIHHHVIPPFYLDENRDRIASSRGGAISPAWLSWSPETTLKAMDQHGVETAVLSLSTPGVWFGDKEASRRTARRVNEYAAGLRNKYPGRFGHFAAVPLPDTEGSLAEIAYALETLRADGVGLLTNYGEVWLGNPAFDAVFEDLNRRQCVVFVHPTAPVCCRNLLPDLSPMMLEVPHDTTRAIASLLFSGSLARLRDIRFIFCHAGGTLPMLAHRISQYATVDLTTRAPAGVADELRRLHFDIAGTAYPPAIAALKALVPTSQILFGSDHPYIPLAETAQGLTALELSEPDRRAIGRGNALRLLPQLATSPP